MIKRITVGFFLIIFLLGLVYVAWPMPQSINDFADLPNSSKSTEEGDTVQVPNVAAYFSDQRRIVVTRFYKQQFENLNIFGIKIPALTINRRVEEADQIIRDQIVSTYFEEYYYPLRSSFYVNGLEPVRDDGTLFFPAPVQLFHQGRDYTTKTTVRYYPSSLLVRLVVYIGIWLVSISFVILVFKMLRKPGDKK